MPSKAIPFIPGFSLKSLLIDLIGTCPSIVYLPIFADWKDLKLSGILYWFLIPETSSTTLSTTSNPLSLK